VQVWMYCDPTNPEVIIYGIKPSEHFGQRQYDIGPIELDEGLIKRYEAAKDAWHQAHSEFVAAVKMSGGLVEVNGRLTPGLAPMSTRKSLTHRSERVVSQKSS
jgi:hypothetical protein